MIASRILNILIITDSIMIVMIVVTSSGEHHLHHHHQHNQYHQYYHCQHHRESQIRRNIQPFRNKKQISASELTYVSGAWAGGFQEHKN
jgi:hypothetical protein